MGHVITQPACWLAEFTTCSVGLGAGAQPPSLPSFRVVRQSRQLVGRQATASPYHRSVAGDRSFCGSRFPRQSIEFP